MTRYDATSAKNRFGQVLEACTQAPVAIERHGRVVAYVVGPAHYAAQPASLEERLGERLRAAGASYATLFGSVARGEARPDSDIDIAVGFGKPMSTDLRMAMTALVADAAGRSVDLVDLETAEGLILSRALRGREIVCASTAARQRMIVRLQRSEDDRRSAAMAARAARRRLFA